MMATTQQQVYVVIGASRGIGLEYIKQLATRTPTPLVFATVRNPTSTTELNNYAKAHNNVRVLTADLVSAESFVTAAAAVAKQVDGVDMLIVNGAQWEDGKVLDDIDKVTAGLIDVNGFGPLRALRAFLPLLRKRDTKKVVFVSSSAGSITLNDLDHGIASLMSPQVPYNVSKTVLNSLAHHAANDLKAEGFIIIPICPGAVATEMSDIAFNKIYPPEVLAAFHSPDNKFQIQTPEASVQCQLKVIDGLTVADTGKYFTHTGNINPW